MIEDIKSLNDKYNNLWRIAILAVSGSILIGAVTVWLSIGGVNRASDRVYVLANGRTMQAIAVDPQANLPVEARDHLRNFHHFFFDLSPDEKGIKASLDRSFYLADASAKILYDNLLESGFINGLISGNITQSVLLDSIWIDTHAEPYEFRCTGLQTLIRQTSLTTRSIITRGRLRHTGVQRSDNNPHGFLIEQFEIEQNKEVKTVTR